METTASLPPPMEKSETGTLEEIPISKPTTVGKSRRRPLRSRTFDTFLRILSAVNSLEEPQSSDKGGSEAGAVTDHDGPLAATEIIPNDLPLQEELSIEETRIVLGTQGGLYDKHVELAECGHNISEGREEVPHGADENPSSSSETKNQNYYDSAPSKFRSGDHQNVPELDIEESNGQKEVNWKVFNNEVCDALESCLDVEEILRVSSPTVDNNCKSGHVDSSASEDVTYEAHCPGMELGKPTSATDLMNSYPDLSAEKDIEEGEISWEFTDLLTEEDKLCLDQASSEVLFPEDVIGDQPKTGLKDATSSTPLSADPINNVGNTMESVLGNKRHLVDYSEVVVHAKTTQDESVGRCYGGLEAREPALQGNASRESDGLPVCTENPPRLRGILKNFSTKNPDRVSPKKDTGIQNNKKRQGPLTEENNPTKKLKESVNPTASSKNLSMLGEHSVDASQEVVDASANKQDDPGEKKKKRVLTKERKAKKKRKERIKRAEKNRKLGVKRLKLQPVIKEKKVAYCRHYLKGRCQEGEKCKFSHDTIPLTKSKPCCHFARNSCMKGDDCPFDHQLSKYPCNNYLSKGFCSRGADCMFSHEAQASETSLTASSVSRPEPKSLPLLDGSGCKKQTCVNGPSSQKVDGKSSSTPISTIKTTEQNLANAKPKLPSQPPKGICFLSQGKLSLDTSSSRKVEAGLSPKVVAGVKKGHEIIHGASEVAQNSTGTTKTTAVTPRGINFLSFGKKPSSDNSSCSFSFKVGNGIGKSPLSNSVGMGAKSDSTINGDVGVKVFSHIRQSIPEDFSNKKEVNSNLLMNQSLKPMLPYMSSSLQKALQSTLAFASKFDSGIKTSRIVDSPGSLTHKS